MNEYEYEVGDRVLVDDGGVTDWCGVRTITNAWGGGGEEYGVDNDNGLNGAFSAKYFTKLPNTPEESVRDRLCFECGASLPAGRKSCLEEFDGCGAIICADCSASLPERKVTGLTLQVTRAHPSCLNPLTPPSEPELPPGLTDSYAEPEPLRWPEPGTWWRYGDVSALIVSVPPKSGVRVQAFRWLHKASPPRLDTVDTLGHSDTIENWHKGWTPCDAPSRHGAEQPELDPLPDAPEVGSRWRLKSTGEVHAVTAVMGTGEETEVHTDVSVTTLRAWADYWDQQPETVRTPMRWNEMEVKRTICDGCLTEHEEGVRFDCEAYGCNAGSGVCPWRRCEDGRVCPEHGHLEFMPVPQRWNEEVGTYGGYCDSCSTRHPMSFFYKCRGASCACGLDSTVWWRCKEGRVCPAHGGLVGPSGELTKEAADSLPDAGLVSQSLTMYKRAGNLIRVIVTARYDHKPGKGDDALRAAGELRDVNFVGLGLHPENEVSREPVDLQVNSTADEVTAYTAVIFRDSAEPADVPRGDCEPLGDQQTEDGTMKHIDPGNHFNLSDEPISGEARTAIKSNALREMARLRKSKGWRGTLKTVALRSLGYGGGALGLAAGAIYAFVQYNA